MKPVIKFVKSETQPKKLTVEVTNVEKTEPKKLTVQVTITKSEPEKMRFQVTNTTTEISTKVRS